MAQLPAQIKTGLQKMQPEFSKALPGHIKPETFIRTAQTALAFTRNIDKAKPESVIPEVTKAAQDGLVLDGREAALVIDYKGNARYQPMARGLQKLARNSGQISTLAAHVAYEADTFEYVLGDDERIIHEPSFAADRGEPVAVYAIAKLKDGSIQREVMSVHEINSIRDRSDAWRAFSNGKIKSTPWSTDWSEMARKTVLRRICKYLPSSTDRAGEIDRFTQAAERIDDDFDFNNDNQPEAAAGAHQPKKRGAGAAAMQAAQAENKKEQPDHDPETGEVIDADYTEVNEGRVNSENPAPEPGDDI